MKSSPMFTTFAALSFEDRCLAAMQRELESTKTTSEVVMLDYGSTATPGSEATRLRHGHWTRIEQQCRKLGIACSRRAINAYSTEDMEEIVREKSETDQGLFVDISCMTKPHVLGLAASLAKLPDMTSWRIAYTKPLSYGDLNAPGSTGGWQDLLWLPLGDDPMLRNQGLAVGLLASGQEADRTSIALREIEPAAGIAMIPVRRDRPDLHRVVLDKNELLFSYLRELRMPGPRGKSSDKFFRNGGWEFIRIRMDSVVVDVFDVVARIVRAALALDGPIVLLPFGPKIVVFLAAWFLAKECSNRCWAVYPVARTHPLGYSDGILTTEEFSSELLEQMRTSILG